MTQKGSHIGTNTKGIDQIIKAHDFIRCRNGVTAKEIGDFLDISPQGAKRYIDRLIEQGDIEEIVLKEPGKTKDDIMRKGYIAT